MDERHIYIYNDIIKQIKFPPNTGIIKNTIFWAFNVHNYNQNLVFQKNKEKLSNFSIYFLCLNLQIKAT